MMAPRRLMHPKDGKDLEELASELHAMGHATRLRLLGVFCSKGTAPMSPTEAATILDDLSLGSISYHTRILRDAGLLKFIRRVPRRGALEHYYGVTDRGRALVALFGIHCEP